MERFSVITSCWGGAAMSEAAELVSSRRQTTEEEIPTSEVKFSGKTTHWTPKLQAISEDSPISSDVDFTGGVRRRTADSDSKKRRVKIKPKTRSAAATPPCRHHGKNAASWKPSINIMVPAFSPTPLLF